MGQKFALVLVATLVGASHGASALSACTAGDFTAQEANCPASGDCTIAKSYSVADGCVLDFTDRNLTLAPTAVIAVGSGALTILANNLTLAASAASGAYINARGPGVLNNQGGTVTINASGAVTIQRNGSTRARIEVSATQQSGTIQIDAVGTVTIAGRVAAAQEPNAPAGGGGFIRISSGSDIISTLGSQILAGEGIDSLADNDVDHVEMNAAGGIDLGDVVDASGGVGENIKLAAGADIIVRGIGSNATSAEGWGGQIDIHAGGAVHLLANPISANGSPDVTLGAEGGYLTITADGGNVEIGTNIIMEERGVASSAGELDITASAAIVLSPGAALSLRAYGTGGFGGILGLTAGAAVTLAGPIDLSGGGDGQGGGELDISAGTDVIISGRIDLIGYYGQGDGGQVGIDAGTSGHGTVLISNVIDADGGPCSGPDDRDCSYGGSIDIGTENFFLTADGKLRARAYGGGGEITIAASAQVRVDGFINTLHVGSQVDPSATDGFTDIRAGCGKALIAPNVIQPPAGISDSGPPCEPTPTASPTATMTSVVVVTSTPRPSATSQAMATTVSSATPSPSPRSTATFSPNPSATSTLPPTQTPTVAPTHSPTPPQTQSATGSATNTVTATHTATAPPAASPSSTGTSSPTPSPTAIAMSSPTPTASTTPIPTQPCVGDCGGDGEVTIEEILLMTSIALGTKDLSACPAGDSSHDGQITVDEILAAVSRALNGCPMVGSAAGGPPPRRSAAGLARASACAGTGQRFPFDHDLC